MIPFHDLIQGHHDRHGPVDQLSLVATPPAYTLTLAVRYYHSLPAAGYLMRYNTFRAGGSSPVVVDNGDVPIFPDPERAAAFALHHRLPLRSLWLVGYSAAALAEMREVSPHLTPVHKGMEGDVLRDDIEKQRPIGVGEPLVLRSRSGAPVMV